MSGLSETTRKIVSEEERKRLIQEIGKIKDVLDSFKYGLNFEEFADEIFKTIDRQTIAIKSFGEQMAAIRERMERLESQLKEGIIVKVSSLTGAASGELAEGQQIVIEEPLVEEPVQEDVAAGKERTELEKEAAELRGKIARLFEKENELMEMVLNDPASADEYEEKARVAREMRVDLEERLKRIEEELR